MADIFNIFNSIPLSKNILWQYDNAPNIKSLIYSKENWYTVNNDNFWQKVIDDFLNITSANDWGLAVWGKILQVSRLYTINGVDVTLSRDLYRRLILGKLSLIHSTGTIPEIMRYCNFIFKNSADEENIAVIVQDNYDMTITYTFTFAPNFEELALIYSRTFLPTPAGVKENIVIIAINEVFGFDGSGLQPFNQAPFWDGTIL